MDDKHEISEHALLSLERQTAKLIEILKAALIIFMTILFSIPVISSLFGFSNSGHAAGLTWTSAWFYGVLAVIGVNYWWSTPD